jgi:hypothetical protein
MSAIRLRQIPVAFGLMRPRIAWIIFCLTVLATAVAKSHFLWATQSLGQDFMISVWNPTHALLHGLNPFVANHPYEAAYKYGRSTASLYTPDIYLVMAPAVFVPLRAGAVIYFIAMLAFTWGTILVVIRPWTSSRIIAGALFGAVILFSLPSEEGLSAGQPTALLAFGVALAIRSAIRGEAGWIAVVGVTIALMKIQTGLPIVLLFLAMGTYWVVIRAVALTLVLSLPGLIAEVRAAHGVLGLIRSWGTNLHYPDATLALGIRVDLAGTVYRLDHYNATVLQGLFGVVLSVLAVLLIRRVRPGLWMWPLVGSFLTLVVYHQEYDVLILLLCFVPIILEPNYYLEVRMACLGMMVIDLACRPTFIPFWLKVLNVRYVSFPGGISTLTTFLLLAIAILVSMRILGAWGLEQPGRMGRCCPSTVAPNRWTQEPSVRS